MSAQNGHGNGQGNGHVKAPFLERLGLGRIVTLSGFCLTALLLAVSAFEMSLDYSESERNAERTARNLVRALTAQTVATVSTIDQSLERVLDAVHNRSLAEVASDPAIRNMLKDMTEQVPFMSMLYISNAKGDVVLASQQPLAKPVSAADREYFTVHRDHADAGLFIGPPVISRVTGKWALPLSRRISGPDGGFAGVVHGTLDPTYLQKLYDTINVGRFGIVSLVLYDGRILVRSPYNERLVGISLAEAPLFKAMRQSGKRAGFDKGVYFTDGRVRITGFEVAEPGPLVIRVALDEEEFLASWRQGAGLTMVSVALFITLMAVMIWVLRKQLKRRERAERASRESGRLLTATIDALTAQLCVLDESGAIMVVNRAWASAAGSIEAPGPVVGAGANYLATCEATANGGAFAARAFAAGIRAVMAGEKHEHVQEYLATGAEGREWFVGRATRFSGGDPARVVVVHQNITARRQVEESLRESERRLAKAQGIAHLGNWEEDLRGGAVWWSEEIYRIFERAPGDFAAGAVSYLQFVHPDDRKALYDQEMRLIVSDVPINFDHRILLPGGNSRIVNLQAELERDSEGRPVRTIGIVQDITDRKKAEADLRYAEQQAVIANRTKTEFLSNMSHELNTPLNAVIGFSEMIAEDVCGPEGHAKVCEFGKVILRAGWHLQHLIADILDLTKIDAGRTALEEEALDLGEVVRERVRQLEPEAEAAGITLLASEFKGQTGLIADRRMIKQILRNLLSNALKFTPEGGAVGVSVAKEGSGGVCLAVEDTGVGMAPEDIPRAFDRFSQVDGSLAREHNGAGLGLALTKLLVEKHGGTIEIVSAVDKGTTVNVRFPAERTFDCESESDPPLICVGFGCKAATCMPILQKSAASPCKLFSMP